jgi:hypothetical protein
LDIAKPTAETKGIILTNTQHIFFGSSPESVGRFK